MSLKEILKQLGIKLIGWVKSNCVNNLLSDRADLPLAAAQGKVLDGKITALNSNIGALGGAVIYNHTTNSGDTLVKLYDSQPDGSCKVQFAQKAGDNPIDGVMDICVSIRSNSTWGFQYVLSAGGNIAVRARNGSTAFGVWKQLL
ncbi:hypothetical protein ACQRCQ_03115 [Lachnospiraceae bacterium SGI.085]